MTLRKGIKYFYKTISALVYFCYTYFIPKDNNLWVFGAWKGKSYSDNSRALFEYVCLKHPNIKAVWIAKRKDVYNEILETGRPVVLYPSKEALKMIAHAKVNVQTESNEDTGKYRVGGSVIIQLFHGFGAAKSAYLYGGMSVLKKYIVKIYADNHSRSYWMVPSKIFVNRCVESCEADEKKIFITGQPRTDVILSQKKVRFFEKIRNKIGDKKLILYVPTHRDYGRGEDRLSNEQWEKLDTQLNDNNCILFFKPHPLELYKYKRWGDNFNNIYLINQNMGLDDASEYLHYFDLLISDYSSIVSDFLALNRPIIHLLYDEESFETETFKLDNVNQMLCGPICKNWDEVINILNDCLVVDKYDVIRKEKQNLFFKYIDTNNCERIYNKIMDILNK